MQRANRRLSGLGLSAATLLFSCASASTLGDDSSREVEVTLGGVSFATVHMRAEPRPYVYPLIGPGGVPLTRGFPMKVVEGETQDHPHHQSMWFAHGNVNGYDFWHGEENRERIVWDGNQRVERDGSYCRVGASYRWLVGEDTLVCTEEREYVFAQADGARTVDVSVTLTPGEEPLVMGDTKEGTFALRVHPALRVTGEHATGRLINSEGQVGQAVWGKRARWIDDSGTVDGQQVGLAIFDHPENPRHPTWWHARTYGLLGANPFGVHDFENKAAGTGALTVPVGESLCLRYRVVLHGAGWDAARVEAAYTDWTAEDN
ncbi:MAG: hypothetical protein ACI8X5_002836 [Planctomycetota bacterium]|jgi:hypothetical protein